MKIGLTYDVKIPGLQPEASGPGPDDLQEEYDSPETIAAIAGALRDLGHEVIMLGDGPPAVARMMNGGRPDLVFNIAEGEGIGRSREARIPAVLELLDIPYTGSDPLTLALTLDKVRTKVVVAAEGVSTPAYAVIEDEPATEVEQMLAKMPMPLIVKPAYEGSSKGIREDSLVRDRAKLMPLVERLRAGYRQTLLVEEFVDGRELTVGVIGNDPARVLGIMEIRPRATDRPFVYGIEAKRDWENQVEMLSPAPLTPEVQARVEEASLRAWRAVGGRDVGRIDFRLRDGIPYFLEINPLPGLSPVYSDLVLMARGIGIDYSHLIGRILSSALGRLGKEHLVAGHHPLQ